MARGRFISESVAKDLRLNSLSVEAELVYLMTIPHLDRDGLIEGDPEILLGTVCPKRRQFLDMMDCIIGEWVKVGLVVSYDSQEGQVLWFKGFTKNQQGIRYDRESPSKFPAPPGYEHTKTGMISCSTPPDDNSIRQNAGAIRQNALQVQVQVKDQVQEGECAHATPPLPPVLPPLLPAPVNRTQPKPGEYLPGLPLPRQRHVKQFVDGIGKQRDRLGLSAAQFTALTSTVLERMNATEIAALDTDMGNDEHRLAQEAALALAAIGHKTPEGIGAVFDTWSTHDWRGEKGETPTYKSIVEHARDMPGKLEGRKEGVPKMSEDEKGRLRTRANLARGRLRTAQQFKGVVDPQWQRDIDAAKALGL